MAVAEEMAVAADVRFIRATLDPMATAAAVAVAVAEAAVVTVAAVMVVAVAVTTMISRKS